MLGEEEDMFLYDDPDEDCRAALQVRSGWMSCADRCQVGLGGVIRRVDQIKERGFPGTGCCGQYNQNAGGESASKEGAIEDAGRRVCRREKPEGSQLVVDGGDGYGGTWPDGPKGKRSAVLVRKRGLSTRTSPARARARGAPVRL